MIYYTSFDQKLQDFFKKNHIQKPFSPFCTKTLNIIVLIYLKGVENKNKTQIKIIDKNAENSHKITKRAKSPLSKMLFGFLVSNCFCPAFMAHCNIGVISADKDLTALCDYISVSVYSCVDNSFVSAGANGFDLGDRVRYFKQSAAALKKVRQKICSETEAKNRNVKAVNDAAQLIYLRGGKELTFVCDHGMICGISLKYRIDVGGGRNNISVLLKTDSGANNINAVAVVNSGLNKPNLHSAFFVIEFCDQCVCRFGRPHCTVFEIKLSHDFISPRTNKLI